MMTTRAVLAAAMMIPLAALSSTRLHAQGMGMGMGQHHMNMGQMAAMMTSMDSIIVRAERISQDAVMRSRHSAGGGLGESYSALSRMADSMGATAQQMKTLMEQAEHAMQSPNLMSGTGVEHGMRSFEGEMQEMVSHMEKALEAIDNVDGQLGASRPGG